jgi:hypothetical protein
MQSNLSTVLNILRLVRDTSKSKGMTSGAQYASFWLEPLTDEGAILRLVAYVCEQCALARAEVDELELSEEAKAGLHQAIQGLATAFSLGGIHSNVNQHIPYIDSAISQLAIFCSIRGEDKINRITEHEKLIKEIESLILKFSEKGIDPEVANVAKRHLTILLTLLQNLEAFGVDAAMAAYAELVIRLQRADARASETSRGTTSRLWPAIKKWSGRLTTIGQAYDSGSELLGHATDVAKNLLNHLP